MTPTPPPSAPRPTVRLSQETKAAIRERIKWLKDKEAHQRYPHSPDYTRSRLLLGRTQGEIGGLEWVLRQGEI